MKRLIALVLALVMCLPLIACGSEKAEKYCWSCGEGISKEVAFCGHCGASVKDNQKETAANTENSEETSTVTAETQTPESPTTTPPVTTTTTPPATTTTPPPTTTKAPATTTQKPAAHSHSYTQVVTQPTCTAQGYTTYTCSCGDTYKNNYTNASHSYSNYKCTKCGEVDKTHAYGYLVEYVKKNGKVKGEYVYINEYSNDFLTQYSINYSASGNYLYVSVLNDNDSSTSSDDGWIAIYIRENSQKFQYCCQYGYQPAANEAYGFINGSTYTTNSPVSCDTYYGNSNERTWFMEYTRISINLALAFLDDYIDQCVPGITIKDLGFANF